MANNINQIRAIIEANLKKISAVYYSELAASTTAESAATARANYAAALRSVQLNANTLIDAQIPFEEAEVQTTNAVLKSGFSPSKIKVTKSPALTYASYGLPISGEMYRGGTLYKVITDDNTNIPINQIVSSIGSLTGQSFADFLSSITVDGQPLVKSIQINLGLSAADSGNRGETGATGTGTTSDCETPLVCDCCPSPYTRGPDGEIILGDGRIVYPFNPVTNPLGFVQEYISCVTEHIRNKYIRCEGETGFRQIEEPGLSAVYQNQDITFINEQGYTPKPYYSPGCRPDPNYPDSCLMSGPSIVGGDTSLENRSCNYTFTDPVTGKQCEVSIAESCFCSSSHILEFSNWGRKPQPPFTPIWTDGDPPKGWCEYWRQYIREHPDENIELPVECSPPQVDGRIITSAVSE